MSDSKRKVNVINTTTNNRRLWLGKGEYVDVRAGMVNTIEIDAETIVSSITEYDKLINERGKGPEGYLIYNSYIFAIEEHSENTEQPRKVIKKKVKRVEK